MNHSEHCSLLVTAGSGPAECNQAVGHVLKRMEEESIQRGLSFTAHPVAGKHGPKSAVVIAYGTTRHSFMQSWIGTILWRMQSQLRSQNKRGNWFIGVFELEHTESCANTILTSEVTFSTLRAGGPGGQHQNTTDSAVRATHTSSGLTVVAREARSQHRNKALALERLQNLADAQAVADREQRKSQQFQLHGKLERGNPVRRFTGLSFKEER